MKQIILRFAMLALSLISMSEKTYAISDNTRTKTRIEIETRHTTSDMPIDRSVHSATVTAYLFPATGIVEVQLFNVGVSDIYIVDSYNNIVDYDSASTDPSTVYLSINKAGLYYLIIISDTVYAEGSFSL